MSSKIKSVFGLVLVVSTTLAAAIPATAAPRYRAPAPVVTDDVTAGGSYVPQGEFSGYPEWARSAFAKK